MNVGLYQGASSMSALEQWQAVVSQNIASASVPGYKGLTVNFNTVMASQDGKFNAPGAKGGGAMPKLSIQRDFSQGELRATSEPENLAITGQGYFKVTAPDGKPAYTRDGEFHYNAEGALVTKSGLPVLGESGAPLTFDATKGQPTFAADGKVSQNGTQVGTVAVFKFNNQTAQALNGGLFRPGDGDKPAAVEKPQVASGFLEQSNVSPLRAMVELITVQRAYDANQKAIGSHDQRLSSAIQILGNPNS